LYTFPIFKLNSLTHIFCPIWSSLHLINGGFNSCNILTVRLCFCAISQQVSPALTMYGSEQYTFDIYNLNNKKKLKK
jgi:hypothetical protein